MFKTINELKQDNQWNDFYVSGKGIAPIINTLGENLVGLELGVARAETAVYLLENCPNIVKYYCIDPWLPYMDWTGMITNQVISNMKSVALLNLSVHKNKTEIIQENSKFAEKKIIEHSLDFIFIDGDHAFDAVLFDLETYWNKVKVGGLFSGHDAGMKGVDDALVSFRNKLGISTPINYGENNIWFWIKE